MCPAYEKSDAFVISEFYRYWQDHKSILLGCTLSDERRNAIYLKYCNKENCKTQDEKINQNVNSGDTVSYYHFDKRYVSPELLRALKGYEYLLIKVIDQSKNPMKNSELVEATGLTKRIVTTTLGVLSKMDLIEVDRIGVAKYTLKALGGFDNMDMPSLKTLKIPEKLFEMLINKEINENEAWIYIAMRRNYYNGLPVTGEALGELLDVHKKTINTTKRQMLKHEIIIYKQSVDIDNGNKAYHEYFFPLEESRANCTGIVRVRGASPSPCATRAH